MELAVIVGKNELLYSSTRSLAILVKFLIDDIGFRKIDSIIEWIKNDSYNLAVLNASYLAKHNEKINIYFFYDGYGREEKEEREKFVISKNELINVIKKWKTDHIEGSYSSLVITVKNETVNLDGRQAM